MDGATRVGVVEHGARALEKGGSRQNQEIGVELIGGISSDISIQLPVNRGKPGIMPGIGRDESINAQCRGRRMTSDR